MNSNALEKVLIQGSKTHVAQIERHVSPLESEVTTKDLNSPIAAFKYFVANNCQPRHQERQSWWNRTALTLGRDQRERLIKAVFQYVGEAMVAFTNAQRLPLTPSAGDAVGKPRTKLALDRATLGDEP